MHCSSKKKVREQSEKSQVKKAAALLQTLFYPLSPTFWIKHQKSWRKRWTPRTIYINKFQINHHSSTVKPNRSEPHNHHRGLHFYIVFFSDPTQSNQTETKSSKEKKPRSETRKRKENESEPKLFRLKSLPSPIWNTGIRSLPFSFVVIRFCMCTFCLCEALWKRKLGVYKKWFLKV